ncbi:MULTISPECIES: 1,2-phenylacetyl-CoA epoxidase subunit PaaC [unclassified Sphingopyxis]|uniref:1,2-phenylacetyl-CoA epoxidase subunit PaaC n=1 Tax=unclassified Sphingopyxis TaxID=2614943 RepID=UPI00285AD46E|nr:MULTISPECIES: 1,2-phenylacetyl-CoA epoxidase subunit PaaC [unclassified Sphingopyxis]MDR6832442.1 ring-1,2-phenylacetyl-CoA epoxidase subunit PaaC [Sphingopyxis sp. BE122]MDR7228185.1 ring-1,2-phenylacetyl-CoA epoxidase subunit PaaC [Sphingopyxis sp. BE259]
MSTTVSMDAALRQPLFDYLLRLGDDSLILGQRLTEWCGHAPTLEVDLSLANVGLDLIGQATLLLDLAGQVEGKGRDGDRLAFHRDVLAFRNCLMVEQPNGDFAQTMARQFLFSTAQMSLLEMLTGSSESRIADIAAKAVKEVRYHADLAAEWVIRLGDGTDESRARMMEGLDWHWRFVEELFDIDPIEQSLIAAGIAVDRAAMRAAFDQQVEAVLTEATLPPPEYPRGVKGGRRGHHSEHLGHLIATMQHLPRTYPGASW